MTQFVEEPLAPQHLLMMTNGLEDGERLLGKIPEHPGELHKSLAEYFDANLEVTEQDAAHLGIFWAWSLVTKEGWEWVALKKDHWQALGVADKERRYVVLPVSYFVNLYHRHRHTDSIVQPAVVYYCISTGDLKDSEPMSYSVVAM